MNSFAGSFKQTPLPIAAIGASDHFAKFSGWALSGLVLLCILAFNLPAAAAEKKVETRMQVSATVLTMLKIKVTRQQSQINVEQMHVAQGYIDVTDASAMLITSNSPEGFMMSLTHDPELVSRVSATITQGGITSEGENMIRVRTQQVRDEPMRISYRLYLNPHARAGSKQWPVAVSFTPRAA